MVGMRIDGARGSHNDDCGPRKVIPCHIWACNDRQVSVPGAHVPLNLYSHYLEQAMKRTWLHDVRKGYLNRLSKEYAPVVAFRSTMNTGLYP
jgi:hypothetical protein